MRFLFIVYLNLMIGLKAFCQTEVYFTPSKDCEDRIVKAIESSKTEVVAAVYSINNQRIVAALVAAKKRGVNVQVLTDRVQASQKNSGVLVLRTAGIDLKVHSKFKIEHNKFGVYDNALISTGSFNWTNPATHYNSENCLFLNDTQVVKKYRSRFSELWKLNAQSRSLAYLEKLSKKNVRPNKR
ncbi:hypothetical protein EBR03_00900 [bacterium]|nr:hypothetical protein [bacterium]